MACKASALLHRCQITIIIIIYNTLLHSMHTKLQTLCQLHNKTPFCSLNRCTKLIFNIFIKLHNKSVVYSKRIAWVAVSVQEESIIPNHRAWVKFFDPPKNQIRSKFFPQRQLPSTNAALYTNTSTHKQQQQHKYCVYTYCIKL